jgi:hypothetical protein
MFQRKHSLLLAVRLMISPNGLFLMTFYLHFGMPWLVLRKNSFLLSRSPAVAGNLIKSEQRHIIDSEQSRSSNFFSVLFSRDRFSIKF